MALVPGESVPRIVADNQHGERVRPDFATPTVLYFYSKDGTPGCTTEARQFEDEAERYEEYDVSVYGVSTDSVESHREFAEREGLPFDLLADPDGVVAEAFGVELTDGHARRTTFVIAHGQVVGLYEGVRPDGHATNVLRDLGEAGLLGA
jgi:peroxiredoxin Q/BCP